MFQNKVLTIGPDYRALRGGIASVLEVYAKYDPKIKFIPTYSSENNFLNILLFPFKYLRIILFLIRNKEYNIVHIHGASQISFYRKYFIFISIKYLLRRKVIYHIHGGAFHKFENDSNFFIKRMIHQMIDKTDAIICLSKNWKNYYKTKYNPNKIFVLNNIIPEPINVKVFNDKGIIQFLFLGKVSEEKGVFDLLKSVQNNKDYLQNKVKIIIGGDGETERLKSKINQLEISKIVEFVGWVSGEIKDKLLTESDIFLLPSYYEGLPISILEAMSYKMPIISTDVGGVSTIVNNNFNGFLIEAGDKDAIFDSIKYFINNIGSINEYGENSFQIVKDFLPDKVVDDLHKIYNSI